MKKIILVVITIAAATLIGLFVYLNQNNDKVVRDKEQNTREQKAKEASKKDIREVVWEQLTPDQKELVGGTWKDGTVSTVTLQGLLMIGVKDKSYEGREVYMVSFDNGLNSVLALADMDTFDVIGFAPVD